MPATSSSLAIILFHFFSSLHLFVFSSSSIILLFYIDSSPNLLAHHPSSIQDWLDLNGYSIQSLLPAENHSIASSGTCAAVLQVIREEKETERCVHAALKTLLICRCLSAFPLSVLCNRPLALASFSFFSFSHPPICLFSHLFPSLPYLLQPFLLHSLPTPTTPFSSDSRSCFSSLRSYYHCTAITDQAWSISDRQIDSISLISLGFPMGHECRP